MNKPINMKDKKSIRKKIKINNDLFIYLPRM